MLTSRTLRAGGRSTTPPCWDAPGLSSISHLRSDDVNGCSAACLNYDVLPFFPSFRQVCLFLKRGANQNAADIDERTPLTIAVEAANADIVTL